MSVAFWVSIGVPAQSNNTGCSLIDNSRETAFIEFEKVTGSEKSLGLPKDSLLLRLRNNSTCSIQVLSGDVEHFLQPLPSKPTVQQLLNRRARTEVRDGEFIPDFEFTELLEFNSDYVVHRSGNDSGDNLASLALKKGNSLLFAVPVSHIKKRLPIIVLFEFEWETKRAKHSYGGDTRHVIWFPYGEIPKSVLGRIQS